MKIKKDDLLIIFPSLREIGEISGRSRQNVHQISEYSNKDEIQLLLKASKKQVKRISGALERIEKDAKSG